MPRVRWTPSPRDAELYGIDGDQVFDSEVLDDLPAGELEKLETEIRAHTGLLLSDLWPPRDNAVPLVRAVMWVTLRLAGKELAWADFDPQIRRARFTPVKGDDVDPPAETPDETSSPEE